MVGGIRDAVMFKDFRLISGFAAIIAAVLVGNLILGRFNPGSPPPMRMTIRRGHPRNTSAPIITNTATIKRIMGDEPPLGLNSPRRKAMAVDPSTK